MDRRKQNAAPPPYQHQGWPSWRYGPDGQSQVFQSEDEVPDGWEDHPSKVGKESSSSSGTEFAASGVSEDDETVKSLMSKTHDDLVEILEDAQDDNEEIEFLKSWPKLKLAQTIVHHDVAPEAE